MGSEIIITHLGKSSLSGQEQSFLKPRITIGRDDQNDVDFDPDENLMVSHKHAEIYIEHDLLLLRDLGSRNGTYLNQQRITVPVPVQPSDSIQLGPNGPQLQARCRADGESVKAGSPPSASETDAVGSATFMGALRDVLNHEMVDKPEGTARSARGGGGSWIPTLLISLLAFAAGSWAGMRLLPSLLETASGLTLTDKVPPEPLAPTAIAALGRIEPDGGVIDVGTTPGEVVESLLVQEGESVKKGQELASLASHGSLLAEVESAKTALRDAQTQLKDAEAYGEALVAEAQSARQDLEAALKLEQDVLDAEVELLRVSFLNAQSDRKKAETAAQRQDSQIASLTQQEQRLEREYKAAQTRLAECDSTMRRKIEQANAAVQTALANQARLKSAVSVEAAARNLDSAEAQLHRSIVYAPIDGQVLRILTKPGETVTSGPVLRMGDTTKMLVNVEVYESDVRRIHGDQEAVISSPALPEPLHGVVRQVLWTVGSNTLKNLNPAAAGDLRVVDVRVAIDEKDTQEHAALLATLINHQVDVVIKLQESKGDANAKSDPDPEAPGSSDEESNSDSADE